MMYRVSSSVANFSEGIGRTLSQCTPWSWQWKKEPCIFFGMYHWGDMVRLLFHRGERRIFWCGSDILALTKPRAWMLRRIAATHFCENNDEGNALSGRGIHNLKVIPMLFDDPDRYPESFVATTRPHVYLTAHAGREEEYGVHTVERVARKVPEVTFHIYGIAGSSKRRNVRYHGKVSRTAFDQETAGMQSALRLNAFDGFSETLAKSILRGQWPITMHQEHRQVTFVESEHDLIAALHALSKKRSTNKTAARYWRKRLKQSRNTLISLWHSENE